MTAKTPRVNTHSDPRGTHEKFFSKEHDVSLDGFDVHEVFMTTNRAGVIRGMHFQKPNPQRKIITCLSGSALTAITDLDSESESYGETRFSWLSSEPGSNRQIFVDEKEAVGYLILDDSTQMLYIADSDFDPNADSGFHPLSIDWPITPGPQLLKNAILSERDQNLPTLEEYIAKEVAK